MKTLVSMKTSALIHLVPRELVPDLHSAAQLGHHSVVTLHALARVGVVGQPAAELFVQGRVLEPRTLARGLDQRLFGAQCDVLHLAARHLHESSVHESSVHNQRRLTSTRCRTAPATPSPRP